jgi:low affinity Fe/Cu permease
MIIESSQSQPSDLVRPPRSSALLHRIEHVGANALAGVTAGVVAGSWVLIGAWFRFPEWWQVALYSCSALVTFVMVFVIQHTQHRQVLAVQRKLDELIRTTRQADNALIAVEHAPDDELELLADRYLTQRKEAVGE